jgi:hypothetical protein
MDALEIVYHQAIRFELFRLRELKHVQRIFMGKTFAEHSLPVEAEIKAILDWLEDCKRVAPIAWAQEIIAAENEILKE